MPHTPELIREFVIAAHGDLAKVQAMLTEDPDLLTVRHQWGPEDFEDGIGAAAHVGNREIAEFFLAQGVPSTICVAGMLGREAEVAQFLAEDSSLANARGAHGIPLLFHVAMSGNTAVAQMLMDQGGGEGLNFAVQGAVNYGHLEMLQWLLDQGATEINRPNFQGKTPLTIAMEKGYSDVADLLRQHGGTESA